MKWSLSVCEQWENGSLKPHVNQSQFPYSPLKMNKGEIIYHTKLYITSKILKLNMLHVVVCTKNIMGINRCIATHNYNTERVTDMFVSL